MIIFYFSRMADRRKETDEKKKENMEVSLIKKRECFGRAKKVVEQLLEEDITECLLLESVKYITQSHYQDVVEERVILKLCGYAICSNKLANVPTKKFHISTKTNTIYDITERKNFCSNHCYKASTFLKEQILTSPVWLRDLEEIPQFKLLPPHNNGGRVGNPVTLDISKLSLESGEKHSVKNHLDFVSSFAINTLQELEKAGGHCFENLFIKEQNASSVAVASSIEKVSNNEEQNTSFDKKAKNGTGSLIQKQEKDVDKGKSDILNDIVRTETEKTESVTEDFSASGGDKVIASMAIKPGNISQAKVTRVETINLAQSEVVDSTRTYIQTSEYSIIEATDVIASTEIDSQKELQAEFKNLKPTSSKTVEVREKVVEFNKEISGEKVSRGFKHPTAKIYNVSKVIKQGPERIEEVAYEWFTVKSAIYLYGIDAVIQRLKEQAGAYDAITPQGSEKLEPDNQFIKLCKDLKLEIERQKDTSNVSEELVKELTHLELKVKAFYEGKFRIAPSTVQQQKEENLKPILPDVDRYSQKSARQKILLSRMSKVLMELFEIFGITFQDYNTQVLGLLQTFNLEAHNIMLRPLEWNLMGLLVIKMLCEKNSELKKSLSKKRSLKCFSMMLESYKLKSDYLDVLIKNLCGMRQLSYTKLTAT